jgi:acetoin utilization deacetylase AcuC-like enzyme
LNTSISFDPSKFEKIKNKLLQERLITARNIYTPPRLSDEDILLSHTRKYLYLLKNPFEVGKILNLDYVNIWDHHLFEYFRYISGGTMEGLEVAYTMGIPVINLGGGYHHAHRDRGEGFCLINDVAIAIMKLRKKFPDVKILIVDLDYHQGNGIIEFFRNDSLVQILTIQAVNWIPTHAKNIFNIEVDSNIPYTAYEEILITHLQKIQSLFSPEVLIYLAGNDVAETDGLGDMHFSESDILRRDIIIYNFANSLKIPILVLAAGGYGPESWKYYYNFIKWIIQHPLKVI